MIQLDGKSASESARALTACGRVRVKVRVKVRVCERRALVIPCQIQLSLHWK